MTTVWKYSLKSLVIEMPLGARLLYVALQDGWPYVWAEVETLVPLVPVVLQVIGTGHAVPTNGTYVGTWQDGPMVWHLYRLEGTSDG